MNRRRFVLALTAVSLVSLGGLSACKKEARCKRCGMKIDPASPWRAELVGPGGEVTVFDTPRCALNSWRSGQTPAKTLRVQEYYDRDWRDGSTVRFMIGGDVSGPMGPDFVPVDPSRVTKFIQDHGAERALELAQIDEAFLKAN